MSLAALIVVDEERAGADLTVFGMPLVEYQARLAQAAGAIHIVIVTTQVPAPLVAALDRLRSRGLNAVLARTAIEAAGQVHPDETVLLFEPGCLPENEVIDRLMQSEKCAIATAALDPALRHQELIDADHSWAGIAYINGALVRKAAELPGDWSLSSALLRFAVQDGANRVAIGDSSGMKVHRLSSTGDAIAATQALSGGVSLAKPSVSGQMLQPISAIIARHFARFAVPPIVGDIASVLLLSAVVGLGLAGWTATALIGFAAAQMVAMIAQRIDKAALSDSPVPGILHRVFPWAGRLLLGMAGYQMFAGGEGWGAVALALWLIWELWLARTAEGRLLADEGSATVLTGAGLLAGFPLIGLSLALLHSLADRFRRE